MSRLGNDLVCRGRSLDHDLVRRGRGLGHDLVRCGRSLGYGFGRRGRSLNHDRVRLGCSLGHDLVRRGRSRRGRSLGHDLVRRGRSLGYDLARGNVIMNKDRFQKSRCVRSGQGSRDFGLTMLRAQPEPRVSSTPEAAVRIECRGRRSHSGSFEGRFVSDRGGRVSARGSRDLEPKRAHVCPGPAGPPPEAWRAASGGRGAVPPWRPSARSRPDRRRALPARKRGTSPGRPVPPPPPSRSPPAPVFSAAASVAASAAANPPRRPVRARCLSRFYRSNLFDCLINSSVA